MKELSCEELSCEREQVLVTALRSGTLDAGLLAHAGICPLCSEALLVAQGLQQECAFLESELRTPDAAVLWRRAQSRARENALDKATLPIRVVRLCAYAVAILAAPWLAFEVSQPQAWMPDLGLRHLTALDHTWANALTGTTLLGITATLVCVGLSSWYMLREK